MSTIGKVAKRDEWEAGKLSGSYAPPSLESEGFIHCTLVEEAAGVANYHYSGHTDLLLLYIDTDRLTSELKWNLDHEGFSWPKIYGSLNVDAVTNEVELKPDTDGRFSLPPT